MKFKQKHIFPPSLVILGGKKYMMPSWTEVPMDTELKDLEWIQPEFKRSVLAKYPSSNGRGTYEIMMTGNRLVCDCIGFKFKGKCKHMDDYKLKNK